jgi:hypothetical protein
MNLPEGFSSVTALEYSCESYIEQLHCLSMALAHAVDACSALQTVVITYEQLLDR